MRFCQNGKNIPPLFVVFVYNRNPPWGAYRDGRCRRKYLLAFGQNLGENMEKAVMDSFWLMRPLLNGYGEKVNGSLIHANRLAFGRAWDYLCIVAAP